MSESDADQVPHSGAPRRSAGAAPTLLPVGGRPPLGVYISQLIARRHFAVAQAKAQTVTANRGMLLGNLWLVLSPLLDAFMFYLIFNLILGTGRGIPNFVGYLVTGMFVFNYTQRTINQSAGVIFAGKGLIRAFAFPRAALPLSVVLRNAIGSIPVFAVLLGFIAAVPPHAMPTPRWLLWPLVLLLQSVFNLGAAFLVARLTDHIPDLRQVIGFFVRLWLYGSCIMFSPDVFRKHPLGSLALDINPAFQAIDISRNLLLYDTDPAEKSWVILAAWAFGLLVIGFVYFWRGEVRYGRG